MIGIVCEADVAFAVLALPWRLYSASNEPDPYPYNGLSANSSKPPSISFVRPLVALLVEPPVLTLGARRALRMPEPAAAGPAAAPKVLVVEDSFTVRELQRSILEAAGYPVVTARDGRDALGILDRDPEIALVVSDLEMPELDGLGLTRAIRADAARSSLPVIIITSLGSEDDQRRGIEAGVDAYMVKQRFDQQALLTTVERLVGR